MTTRQPVPPIDPEKLHEVTFDDPGFERELLEIFLEESVGLQTSLEEALSSDQQVLLRRSAHTLKGSSGSIGAVPLCDASHRLEMAAAPGVSTEACQVLVQEVVCELARLRAYVEEKIAKDASETG